MHKRLINFDDLLDVTKHMMPLENIFVPRKEFSKRQNIIGNTTLECMGLKLNFQSHIFSDFVLLTWQYQID